MAAGLSDRSTVTAVTIATAASAAPIRYATWKPPVSAAAVDSPSASRLCVRSVEIVASRARPIAPPTWPVVFTRPDARPASLGVAPDIASIIRAGKATPAPAPKMIIVGNTSTR